MERDDLEAAVLDWILDEGIWCICPDHEIGNRIRCLLGALDALGFSVHGPEDRAVAERLAEAEEKIAYLQAGCRRLDRDQLIQRITAVGAERWQAGHWLSDQLEPLRAENRRLREELAAREEQP